MRFDSLYPLVPLGKLVEFINGDRSSNYPKPSDYVDGGIPFISATDIDGGRINLMSAKRISRSAFERLRGGHVRRGDILLCLRGSLGKMGVVQNIDEGAIASSLVILRSHDESILRYVRYVLSGGAGMALLDSLNNGSVQGNISVASLKKMEVPFPPRLEMEAIGSLISMFDMRIDLLLETNASLESISEAFFKSWFIDFDPVRAKAEGREPEGMSADIAALFPSEFVDSELGPIPKGWNIQTLGSIADVVKGKSYSSKDLVSGGSVALVTLKSFERGGGFRMDGFKPYAGLYKPSQVVRAGDVIVAYTDVTQAAELIGRPAIVVEVEDYETLVASLDVGIIRPVAVGVSKEYLFGLLQSETFLAHALAHTTGTTVLHLAKEAVPTFRAAIPSAALIAAYSFVGAAIRSKIQSNIDMGRSLMSLRDHVLPALLSGRMVGAPIGELASVNHG